MAYSVVRMRQHLTVLLEVYSVKCTLSPDQSSSGMLHFSTHMWQLA